MWQYGQIGGQRVMKMVGRDGVTYMLSSQNYDSSAMIEWSLSSALVRVSVVHGEYVLLSEWLAVERFYTPWDTEELTLMALERWQQQLINAPLNPSSKQRNTTALTMVLEVLEVLIPKA